MTEPVRRRRPALAPLTLRLVPVFGVLAVTVCVAGLVRMRAALEAAAPGLGPEEQDYVAQFTGDGVRGVLVVTAFFAVASAVFRVISRAPRSPAVLAAFGALSLVYVIGLGVMFGMNPVAASLELRRGLATHGLEFTPSLVEPAWGRPALAAVLICALLTHVAAVFALPARAARPSAPAVRDRPPARGAALLLLLQPVYAFLYVAVTAAGILVAESAITTVDWYHRDHGIHEARQVIDFAWEFLLAVGVFLAVCSLVWAAFGLRVRRGAASRMPRVTTWMGAFTVLYLLVLGVAGVATPLGETMPDAGIAIRVRPAWLAPVLIVVLATAAATQLAGLWRVVSGRPRPPRDAVQDA
ncbi:hypothetical protein [Sphaerisporangium sp. TRM90804]|uniref:hypothetical protein n=1 Tax=Sphaerisporangium sp. TRM90804 TaxID=3031113 RepID=UPI00244BE57A|nr:hypothetical protein [Sphaerisporangium sp. TRM90804]MDH2424331.1 hypothetical protein [Sphaerisporangium sp. TRM90804]